MDDPALLKDLEAQQVRVTADIDGHSWWWRILTYLFPIVLRQNLIPTPMPDIGLLKLQLTCYIRFSKLLKLKVDEVFGDGHGETAGRLHNAHCGAFRGDYTLRQWGISGQIALKYRRNALHSTPSFRRGNCNMRAQMCRRVKRRVGYVRNTGDIAIPLAFPTSPRFALGFSRRIDLQRAFDSVLAVGCFSRPFSI